MHVEIIVTYLAMHEELVRLASKTLIYLEKRFRLMVFNATLQSISVISWWSVLLVEDTGENHRPDKLDHVMLYRIHLNLVGFELTTLVVISFNCINSFKSNYHATMTCVVQIYISNMNKLCLPFAGKYILS